MIPTINKRETGIWLRRIMDTHNISVKDVQKYLGLSSVQSVYHWLNGISLPTLDNLYALSELFHMSLDAMVRGDRKTAIPAIIPERNDFFVKRMQVYYEKI